MSEVDDVEGLIRVLRMETRRKMPQSPIGDELLYAAQDAADTLKAMQERLSDRHEPEGDEDE